MTDAAAILVFAGSTRKDALSKQLARAVSLEIQDQGGAVNLIDLADYSAPLYNGDDEEAHGVPQTIQDLNALIRRHDGLVIATPEYNGFFTPLLKNTLDWCSRPGASSERPPLPRGKPACIVASAGGPMGGVRAIPRLRDYLLELGFLVCPESHAIARAGNAFAGDGRLQEEAQAARIKVVVAALLELAGSVRQTGHG